MRVVLDTNVLISGLLSPVGPCGRIVDLALPGALELCVDARILEEYCEVAGRPELSLPPAEAARLLGFIRLSAEPVIAVPLAVDLPDADDLPFLEVAVAAGAALVTGNRRHYPADRCPEVEVLDAAGLLDRLRRESASSGEGAR